MENLHWDRYQKDISDNRWGDRAEILHRNLSKEREEDRKRGKAEI